MSSKKIPRTFQVKVMEFFREYWAVRSGLDVTQILRDMPPAMSSTIGEILYHRFLSNMPLFRGLSSEVIDALCHEVQPLVSIYKPLVRNSDALRYCHLLLESDVYICSENLFTVFHFTLHRTHSKVK
eukprot:SAG31_NODE_3852_length_3817_cov_6.007800_4_plen_127_part_00